MPRRGSPVKKGGRAAKIASPEEVLEFFTNVMRGTADTEENKPDERGRMKAAELLGKRYGLFETAESGAPNIRIEVDYGEDTGSGAGKSGIPEGEPDAPALQAALGRRRKRKIL